jgi:hypothetical protein
MPDGQRHLLTADVNIRYWEVFEDPHPSPATSGPCAGRERQRPLPHAGPRERQRERIDNGLQGGRLGGRDAPRAPGGALAPVRVGPAGAPLGGAGPSSTDPALTVNAESRVRYACRAAGAAIPWCRGGHRRRASHNPARRGRRPRDDRVDTGAIAAAYQ